MRAVAKRFVAGVLAVAQRDLFRFVDHDLHRLKPSALVAAVAIRLVARLSTGAPPIRSQFNLENGGLFAGDGWLFVRHGRDLPSCERQVKRCACDGESVDGGK